MKTILLIFIIALTLKAESIYQGKCVSSFKSSLHTSTGNANIILYFSDGTTSTVPFSSSVIDNLILNNDKYSYSALATNIFQYCTVKTANYNNLGITENQFNFLSALTGLLTSILLVFIIFLKV